MEINLKKIIEIYELEIRKNTLNKKKIWAFELRKMSNCSNIYNRFVNGDYFLNYHIFLIHEPKTRVIMSLDIKDKIMNHYITKYLLILKLEKRLEKRNIATRKGLGTSYGRKLIKRYLEEKKEKSHYALTMDISKYFYSINHEVLINLVTPYLENDELEIIKKVLESTDELYINERIKVLDPGNLLPRYQKGVGLPIGNMTSQFLAIFYLNEIDHKIIHDYRIRKYLRYMDDFLLISESKEELKKILEKLEKELKDVYHLQLNKSKTKIVNLKEGFIFLGYHYKVKNNKTIVTIPQEKKVRIRCRIKSYYKKYQRNEMTLEAVFNGFQTLKHGEKVNRWFIKKTIRNGWFHEFKK